MNPAEWLVRTARLSPEAPALLCGERIVADYRGFAQRAAAIGGALHRLGLEPGDRVAVVMANATAYLEILYGIWFAGLVAVPVNAKLHPREAAWIVADAGARVVFTDDAAGLGPRLAGGPGSTGIHLVDVATGGLDAMRAAEPMRAPLPRGTDDLAWLFYTSGTTGKPKGVMLSSGNLAAMAFSYFVDVDQVHASDAMLYAAPLSHGAGLYTFMAVMKGARHVVPASGHFDPAEIEGLARALDTLTFFAAPTMVRRLVDHARASGWDGAGIRTVVYGGGPMYLADIREAVDVMGPRFVQIYGQGESPMTITALSRARVADRTHPRWRERLASVGVAQSSVRVRVVDAAGCDRPAGEPGEIVVAGAPVMSGYWGKPEASAEALRDGWLWTGDIGVLDADGFLTLSDRSKDVIISGGTNIYPREVEEALLEHAGVHEVAVVGRPHPDWGEEVVAFVVAAAGCAPQAEDLDAHCLGLIARFKRPKAYRFVEALPKNNYGKVLKTALRAELARAAGAPIEPA